MRKFTVSAIIFTALTGCSQSNKMPSAQWSFEAPAGKDINGTQIDGTYSKNTPTVDLSAIATFPNSTDHANRPITSQLIPPALTHGVVQPADTVIPSHVADITASRSDFLNQVNDYLQASSRPSALTHLTPSASQLYLTTLPTAAQSQPSNAPEPLLRAEPLLETEPLLGAEPLLGNSHTLAAGLSADNSSGMDVLTNAAYGEVNQPATETSNVAILPARFEDNLPQLEPAQPINFEALPTIVQTDEIEPSDKVSIGTAILRDLQLRDLQRSAMTTTVSDSSTPTPQTITPPTATQTQPTDSNLTSNNVSDRTPIAPPPTFTARTSDNEPTGPTGPTLARLIQTMPQRELSPLVARRQNATEPAQSTQPAAGPLERPNASITGYVTDYDASPFYPLYPALLTGLNAAEIQATVYVPTIETTSINLSRALSQETAIGKDTLKAISINEISFQNVFSSELTLATLLGNETATALKSKAVSTLTSASEKTPEKAINLPQKTQTAPQVFWSKRFLSSLSQPAHKRHQLTARR